MLISSTLVVIFLIYTNGIGAFGHKFHVLLGRETLQVPMMSRGVVIILKFLKHLPYFIKVSNK